MNDWTTTTDPALLRIAITTSTAPDLAAAERAYVEFLRHRVVERGVVSEDLAAHWEAPASAGAAMVTMTAEDEEDVFVRLVEAPTSPEYRPLTSYGWNAFETIADDVFSLAERLHDSPFRVIGPPKPLQFMPSIVAMQVIGPCNECLYFTMESGDRESSLLPPPSGAVGRTFIVVAAGPDFPALLRWYVDQFQLRERPVRQSRVAILQQAQGVGPEQEITLSAIGMRQRGNLLELDGYPNGPGFVADHRVVAAGHLPPGNAIASFEVADLTPYAELAFCPPVARQEAAYAGRRACTLRGPAGELIELVAR